MSLRYVVPTVGLLAAAAGPALAEDVGALTIDGYVDTILEFIDVDDPAVDDAEINFTAAAQLEVGYAIGDNVSANIELRLDEQGGGSGGGDATLEQAYVSWQITEQVALTMGRMHNWIGWEGLDAPDLYRINNSWMYTGAVGPSIWGDDVTGLNVTITPSEDFTLGIYIIDYIWDEAVGTRATDAFSFGARGDFAVEGIGSFFAALGLGVEEVSVAPGSNEDILDINVGGEIDAIREDTGLLFAFDFHHFDYDFSDGMAILLAANYKFSGTSFPMSASLFIDYYEPDSDADDDEQMEIALALLTNPTDNENFSVNVELRIIDNGDAITPEGELGVFLEALAVIP